MPGDVVPCNAAMFTLNVKEFTDVTSDTKLYEAIRWMAGTGVSKGYDDGSYRPVTPVARDAMAAFMYRFAGSPEYKAPAKSPFADVSTTQEHYKEMAWMCDNGLAEGWAENGVRNYHPFEPVNRDAMAAFLYRLAYRLHVEGPGGDHTLDPTLGG